MNSRTLGGVAGLAGAVGITAALAKLNLPPIGEILGNPLYIGGAALALLLLLK
jgi:hypothetical protein